jgi:hypothetical protein
MYVGSTPASPKYMLILLKIKKFLKLKVQNYINKLNVLKSRADAHKNNPFLKFILNNLSLGKTFPFILHCLGILQSYFRPLLFGFIVVISPKNRKDLGSLFIWFSLVSTFLGFLIVLHAIACCIYADVLGKDFAVLYYNRVLGGFVYHVLFIALPSFLLGLCEKYLPYRLRSCWHRLPLRVGLLNLIFLIAALFLLIAALRHGPNQPPHPIFEYYFGSLIRSGYPAFDLNILSLYVSNTVYGLGSFNLILTITSYRNLPLKDTPWWVWVAGLFALFLILLFCPGIVFLLLSYNN